MRKGLGQLWEGFGAAKNSLIHAATPEQIEAISEMEKAFNLTFGIACTLEEGAKSLKDDIREAISMADYETEAIGEGVAKSFSAGVSYGLMEAAKMAEERLG